MINFNYVKYDDKKTRFIDGAKKNCCPIIKIRKCGVVK